MLIGIIGAGKLGLAFGLNLSLAGHEVIAMDHDQNYIDKLKRKEFISSEPGITEALQDTANISFTTSLSQVLEANVIFVVVPTPSTSDFKYDHSAIEAIAKQLKEFGYQGNRKELVINCTTFPGFCETLSEEMQKFNYYVSYNPEFIAQGSIMRDQVFCDCVLIGSPDEFAANTIKSIYQSFVKSNPTYHVMRCTEAEITKLSVNCFLTTKIAFANMIGDIAVRYDCNQDVILNAIGSDSRIGSKYLRFGFGFGGPCFPRDNRALAKCASEVGITAVISEATDLMNDFHLNYQIDDFIKKNPDKSMIVEIDYVTYKKESILIEESQQLKFALKLKELGYQVKIADDRPEVISQLKGIFYL